MRDIKEGKGLWGIMQSKLALIFLGVVIVFFAWNVFGFLGKMRETAKNRDIIENSISNLKEAKTKLSADISKLETTVGVEETIRDKFGLAKEDEQLIVIVDEKNPQPVNKKEKSKGFFHFFKNLLK